MPCHTKNVIRSFASFKMYRPLSLLLVLSAFLFQSIPVRIPAFFPHSFQLWTFIFFYFSIRSVSKRNYSQTSYSFDIYVQVIMCDYKMKCSFFQWSSDGATTIELLTKKGINPPKDWSDALTNLIDQASKAYDDFDDENNNQLGDEIFQNSELTRRYVKQNCIGYSVWNIYFLRCLHLIQPIRFCYCVRKFCVRIISKFIVWKHIT